MESSEKNQTGAAAAGLGAGILNGLFGGGGGLLLIPGLSRFAKLEEEQLFPTSVTVMLPVSILTLICSAPAEGLPWSDALPYLVGSALGGMMAGFLGKRIPVLWLHRILGAMLLWGGVRYLW